VRERDLRHSGGDASAFISKHQCSLVSEIYGSVQPERERERERENREKVSEQRSEREDRKKGEREERERASG
jgi:hypothetical protein